MTNFRNIAISLAAAGCIILNSCGSNETAPVTTPATEASPAKIVTPSFSGDTAYSYVSRQVAFGARVPGSKAQQQCATWMQAALQASCDTVYRQETTVRAANGTSLPCINLIGAINPAASTRILLLTHWDSRPWADQDTRDMNKPILAADDGGSGTAVLLELARQIKAYGLSASIGIDILLTDVEDYGKSEWGDDSYCLGTQYWAAHPHIAGYKANYGILLDMVGARGAQFPLEAGSTRMAGEVQQKVWQAAAMAGCSSWFPYAQGPEITDDHVPVNKIAGIPTIDIIHMRPDPQNPFPLHWHTHADDMSVIDKETLGAVGRTLLQVIYTEAAAVVN